MLTGQELGAAIERARLKKGITKKKLADDFDVKPPSVQGWTSHGRIGKDKLMALIDYFSDVVGPEHWGLSRKPKGNAQIIGPISAWDDSTPVDDDEVEIPLLKDVRVSGGPGVVAEDLDSGRCVRMGKSSLRERGVQFSNAICVTVSGNSMEPALPDGSTVGVNMHITTIKDGKVYVIKHDGELRVKQVYRLPGGGIRLRSFNRAEHADEDYTPTEMAEKDISILGKVFWSSAFWD